MPRARDECQGARVRLCALRHRRGQKLLWSHRRLDTKYLGCATGVLPKSPRRIRGRGLRAGWQQRFVWGVLIQIFAFLIHPLLLNVQRWMLASRPWQAG